MTTRIAIDPEVCGGRPIVAGTRMRVSDILDALASGATIDELLADFPYIVHEDIIAASPTAPARSITRWCKPPPDALPDRRTATGPPVRRGGAQGP